MQCKQSKSVGGAGGSPPRFQTPEGVKFSTTKKTKTERTGIYFFHYTPQKSFFIKKEKNNHPVFVEVLKRRTEHNLSLCIDHFMVNIVSHLGKGPQCLHGIFPHKSLHWNPKALHFYSLHKSNQGLITH